MLSRSRTPEPSASLSAPTEVLHITVERAEDLLPVGGRDSCDAYCTVRAMPGEQKHGRRTGTKLMTRDPEWNQTFTIPLTDDVCEIQFKVCHKERMGRTFLGTATAAIPPPGDVDGLTLALPLASAPKHILSLVSLARTADVAPTALGTLYVQMWRAPPSQGAPLTPRRSLLSVMAARRLGGGAKAAAKGPGATPSARPPPLAVGAQPCLDGFVHVDVVRARGLLPMDRVPGREASTWTSDPFVTAQLLPSAAGGAVVAATSAARATLSPVWEEELVLPAVPRATAIKLLVYDKDALGTDDYMGEVTLPLPPRPSDGARAEEALASHWAPLTCCAPEREALAHALRSIGKVAAANALVSERRSGGAANAEARESSAAAGALGELFVRISWGAGVRAPDVNARPALRPRIGTLRVRVHEARGLQPRYADRPLATVRCEHQQGTTPAATATRDPVWPAEASDFTFVVTEVTSDVVFTVIDRDPMLGDQVAGEVCIPLPLLLAAKPGAAAAALAGPRFAGLLAKVTGTGDKSKAGVTAVDDRHDDEDDVRVRDWCTGPGAPQPRWAELLPRRGPGEALQSVRPKPERPLGAICFTAQLTLDCSAVFAYGAPDVMPLEPPPGKDTSQDFSLAALNVSLGRTLDGIFMPMFAGCRTLLYLQSWQAPRLNATLIAILIIGTLKLWFLMKALTPLWLLLCPVLNGYVSYLIHEEDYIPAYADEAADEANARAAVTAAQLRRDALVAEAQSKALAAAREAGDPAASAAAASAGVGLSGAIGNLFGGGGGGDRSSSSSGGDSESAAALSAYKRIKGKLEYTHVCCLYYADMLETWSNLFTWRDSSLSAVVALAALAFGLAASVALTSVCLLASALGLGVQHLVLALGMACFWPSPGAMRAYLEFWDYYLSYFPVTLTSQVAGAGLAATVPPERRLVLSEAALRERVEAEAQAKAVAAYAAEEAARHARGRVRHVTLTLQDVRSLAWLPRLIARAPTVPRDTHTRIAARVAAAQRPSRAWANPGDGGGAGATSPAGVPPQRTRTLGRPPTIPRSPTTLLRSPGAGLATPTAALSGASMQPQDTPRSSMDVSVDDEARSSVSGASPASLSPPASPALPSRTRGERLLSGSTQHA